MTVIGSLHTGLGVVALRVRFNVIGVEAHDLSKEAANLVLGVFVLARELQYTRQRGLVLGLEVLGCNVCMTSLARQLRLGL